METHSGRRQNPYLDPAMALKEAQDRIARLVPRNVSLVDELIAERRAEAMRELLDHAVAVCQALQAAKFPSGDGATFDHVRVF
jgi:hypothetical protein